MPNYHTNWGRFPTPPENYADQKCAFSTPYRKVDPRHKWLVRTICCGLDMGARSFASWEAADCFRQGWAKVSGHDRVGIIVRAEEDEG